MIKKVLVVGGAGYIGGTVTDELILKKIPFIVYDNLTYENHFLKPVSFLYGDIRDHKKLKKILPDFSHIIWLAAITGEKASDLDPKLTKDINQLSLRWIANNFSGRIIFTSTCAVYGESKEPVTEKSPTKPISLYGQTKLKAESFLKDKQALIFRLGTAYGLGDRYSRLRMDISVNYMSVSAIKDNYIEVFQEDKGRGFIHVKDIGKIMVDNLNNKYTGIINLATENFTIKDLALMMQSQTDCKIFFKNSNTKYNLGYFVDSSKGLKKNMFSFKNIYELKDGFNDMRELVLSGKVKDFNYQLYYTDKFLKSVLKSQK